MILRKNKFNNKLHYCHSPTPPQPQPNPNTTKSWVRHGNHQKPPPPPHHPTTPPPQTQNYMKEQD